jgi:hypothetical protein
MKAYGSIELAQASPAQSFVEPLTLLQVKTYLRIPDIVDDQDYLLESFITAARVKAEQLQNKELVLKQWDLNLDLLLGYDAIAGAAYPSRFNTMWNFGIGYEINLKHPLQSVDLFQYRSSDGTTTTLAENTDYVVDKNRSCVVPPFGKIWPFFTPYPTSAVLCRFTSGYPTTHPFWSNDGKVIIAGMYQMISGLYEGRLPGDLNYSSSETLMEFGSRPRVS